MNTNKLRKILASEGLIKSAGWDGDVYFDSKAVDHPDFETVYKWAKNTTKDKRLFLRTEEDRPYDRIVINLLRSDRLQVEVRGRNKESIHEYTEPDIYPSVGGDYLVSSGGGWSTKEEYVERVILFTQDADGSWKVYAGKRVGRRAEVEKRLTAATLRGALRKFPELIREIA